jgi:hypothetical protein
MKISLLDTRDGTTIWSYNPEFDAGSGGIEKDEMRATLVNDILNGFRNYFPYSKDFIGQKKL